MGGVRLSEDYASLINGGNVTFLDMRLVGAIAHQPCYGAIATRLYLMLEAQQGPGHMEASEGQAMGGLGRQAEEQGAQQRVDHLW